MTMLPLYLGFVFISLLGFLELFSSGRGYKILYSALIIVTLVSVASLRSVGVGSDDLAYVSIFNSVPNFIDCENFLCGYSHSAYGVEIGFFWFLSILSVFSYSQYWLFFSVAFLSVYFNLKGIRYFSPYVGASSLVYFSHFFLAKEMNAIRVGLASAVLFFSVIFLTQRRYFLMSLLFVLAVIFHVTSLIFLIPLVVYLIAPGRLIYLLAGLSIVFFVLFFDLSWLVSYLASFGPGFVGEKISLYLNSDEYNYVLPVFDVVNIRNLLIISFSLLFWNKISLRYEWFSTAFCFFYSAAMFRILFGHFAIFAGRGYSVISMFEYILIPCLACFAFGRRKGYFLILVYTLLTLWINLTFNNGWSGGAEYFDDSF
ncbi:MAG: EpsG family protein [Gammaproteobacteria bacterium]|nr:EpsG family protein [Gammaproteobacteria bacterium]